MGVGDSHHKDERERERERERNGARKFAASTFRRRSAEKLRKVKFISNSAGHVT